MTTSMSRHWSQSTWRQAPHGDAGGSASVTTATARNFRAPSEIALKTAVRSAHTVRPYDADSTLQPVKIVPSSARSAAPTRKLEYGAEALLADRRRRGDEALLPRPP